MAAMGELTFFVGSKNKILKSEIFQILHFTHHMEMYR